MKRLTSLYDDYHPIDVVEDVVVCPICNAKDCMHEQTTTREQLEEVIEETIVDSFLCMTCGYTSNSNLALDTETLKSAVDKSPRLVVDLAFKDTNRSIMWFPSVINIRGVGVVYPEGTPNDWSWVLSPVVPMSEEEQKTVLQGSGGNSEYSHRLAIEQSKKYSNRSFREAMKDLEHLIKMNSNEPTAQS